MTRALAILLLLTATATAAEPQTYYRATVGSVHDGDTLTLDIDVWPKIRLGWVTVRAADFDAWECTKARIQVEPFRSFAASQWIDEIDKGLAARDDLTAFLATGKVWIVPDTKPDPYGRIRAKWYVQTKDDLVSVAEWMKARGHTR